MISNCSTFDGKTVHFSVAIYTSAIILSGIVSNYSSVGPSFSHIIAAKGAARDILDSILDGKKL